MRREPFTIDSHIHVYNRGTRKQPIVRDSKDWWHLLQILFYFNSEDTPMNPFEDLRRVLGNKLDRNLIWPKSWPKRVPLTRILAYALMKNHLHLLIQEIREGGTAKFMARLGDGTSKYYNTKYHEVGSIWQGTYQNKTVYKDMYLKDVSVYVQVKNPFERYPGGLQTAIDEFDKAYDWVAQDPYSSLGVYAGKENHPAALIIDKGILGEMFKTPEEYKEFAHDSMLARGGMMLEKKLEGLIFEEML